jgi:molybdenum cofactor cytidylyltransferase
MSIAIVIVAAGEAKRFGSAKLVATIDGVPLVRRAALAALNVCAQVVVVTGAHRAVVEGCIADLAITRVFNANWAEGLGGSIARGIQALNSCDAAIIMLADQALIGAPELRRLIDAHAVEPQRIIAAQYANVLGPPCLFPHTYFPELAALRGDQGARSLLRRHAQLVDALPMPGAAVDIDAPQDLSAFTSGA